MSSAWGLEGVQKFGDARSSPPWMAGADHPYKHAPPRLRLHTEFGRSNSNLIGVGTKKLGTLRPGSLTQ